jgi:predicted N-acetyltransferase YhbS
LWTGPEKQRKRIKPWIGKFEYNLSDAERTLRLRPGVIGDANEVGKIIFEAFSGIADKHGFSSEIPNVDFGIHVASSFLSSPGSYSVVAEDAGENSNKVIGSNFLDERSNVVAGVGPITVDPKFQDKGVGRQLMINVMERARNKNYPTIRLLQSSYHNRSLVLYASLGFEIREPISNMQGKPIQAVIPGRSVRAATEAIWSHVTQSAKQFMATTEVLS